MTAVQPFSYLTAEPAPSKSAFRRQEDFVETAVHATEDISLLGQAFVPAPYQLDCPRTQVTLGQASTETGTDLRQQHQQQQQPEGVVYTGNRPDNVIANGYNRPKQWESPVNDQRRNPPQSMYAPRPPDVAPKHTKALDLCTTEKSEAPNRDGVSAANKSLYNQLNAQAVDRPPENTQAIREPVSGSASNLYGHVNRYRGPDSHDARKPDSHDARKPDSHDARKPDSHDARKVMPQRTPNDCSVPYSYTQPAGSFGVVTYGDVESRSGGSNHNQAQPELDNRTRESPTVGTTDNLNIFENFILVGPEKPPIKEVAPKEPVKRLKLEELFDPPPLPMAAAAAAASHDPHKVSILGVTNTESCDYLKSKDSDRTKKLVSTFDNPDYNLQDRPYTPSGSMQGLSDQGTWSARANNTFKEAGNSASLTQRRPAQSRCVTRKLCAAILVTMFITSVVCLGAGFIAGWFGRGKALGL